MNFEFSERSIEWQERVASFIGEHILPVEREINEYHLDPGNAWTKWPGLEKLKEKVGSTSTLKKFQVI